jgi:hypothetical protein
MHECGDCDELVFLWCKVCEACKNCDDLGKGHACRATAAPSAAVAVLNRARTNQADGTHFQYLILNFPLIFCVFPPGVLIR